MSMKTEDNKISAVDYQAKIEEADEQQTEVSELIVYQLDETIRMDVRLEDDTVWLSQAQMATLFDTVPQNITIHIKNIYSEGELREWSTCKDSLQVRQEGNRTVRRKQKIYNLDVIISVGYRVKSKRGVEFRQWANKVLKDYLLRGYAINQRMENLEQRVKKTEEQIDFFVKLSLPPVEGVFFDGQVFDAYRFVADLVKKARHRIVLIDNYVDEGVLALLDKRATGVEATIYTNCVSNAFRQDVKKHNEQYAPIQIEHFGLSHDRFLIIDDEVYHIGASIKDLGKKWFAFTLMKDITPSMLLSRIAEA